MPDNLSWLKEVLWSYPSEDEKILLREESKRWIEEINGELIKEIEKKFVAGYSGSTPLVLPSCQKHSFKWKWNKEAPSLLQEYWVCEKCGYQLQKPALHYCVICKCGAAPDETGHCEHSQDTFHYQCYDDLFDGKMEDLFYIRFSAFVDRAYVRIHDSLTGLLWYSGCYLHKNGFVRCSRADSCYDGEHDTFSGLYEKLPDRWKEICKPLESKTS